MQKRAGLFKDSAAKQTKTDPIINIQKFVQWLSGGPSKPSVEGDTRADTFMRANRNGKGDPIRGYNEFSEKNHKYEQHRQFRPK